MYWLLLLSVLTLHGCSRICVATVIVTPTNINTNITNNNNNNNTATNINITSNANINNNYNNSNNNTNTNINTHVLTNATTITLNGVKSNNNHNNNHNFKYPCAFIDTVNISGSYSLYEIPSDTYIHDSLRIPHELVAVYDFVIVNGGRRPAERHLRACVCRVKPCLRYCCPAGQYYDLNNRTCTTLDGAGITAATTTTTETTTAAISSSTIGITAKFGIPPPGIIDQSEMLVELANGSSAIVNTTEHFVVHVGAPCAKMRLITKDNQLLHWTLFENGTVAYEHHLFPKHYCYTPYQTNVNAALTNNNYNNTQQLLLLSSTSISSLLGNGWEWQPLACEIEKFPFVLGVTEWTYAICLIIAVICMFITLFIHLLCNELRNTFYGVAIKSYTICIIIGYSLLAHLTLTNPAHLARARCSNIACCILLFILLSFLLLCFISFNFYLNYHGITLTKPMFWLIFCPIVLLAIGWALFARFDYYGGKPVFGYDTCWFDPRNFSILAYFYAPILIACLVCIFFYTITLLRISERNPSELNKLATDLEENRFKSFWSFFCYTFGAWLVCLISFVIHHYLGKATHINYLVCLFIALHGFGALYTLVGKNQQIQNFMRRIEDGVEENDRDEDNEDEERIAAMVFSAVEHDEADIDVDIDEVVGGAGQHQGHVPLAHF